MSHANDEATLSNVGDVVAALGVISDATPPMRGVAVETQVAGIIRWLASYTATGSLSDMAHARTDIKTLWEQKAEIALPLLNVALYLQRHNHEEGADNE